MTQSIEIKKVLLKRGNTAQSMAYTGPLGEITIDTELRTIRVHDGVTPGGSIVVGTNEAVAASVAATIENLVGAAPEALDTLAELAAALGSADDTITGLIDTLAAKANSADLAEVATTGSYTDLADLPVVPIDVSDLTDNNGLLLSDRPVQPYLEVTNTPFIALPAELGEPVTVVAEPAGSGASFDVVIGDGPVIDSVTINNPGTGYAVGQNYDILYYTIGGTGTADNITFEVGTVGEAGEILTLAAYVGAGSNTPGTYTEVNTLDYKPSVFDTIDNDLTLTRDNQGALFNPALEPEYDNNTHLSPLGTEWNSEGWGDLLQLGLRSYTTLRRALDNSIGENIVDSELVMHDTVNDRYYKFDFTNWGQNNVGGFAYTRTEVTDPNYFRKTDGGEEVDVIVEDDGEGGGIGITRGSDNSIYNPYREEGYNEEVSPAGTLWNTDGWNDLSDVETRTYSAFYDAYNGGLGNRVPGSKAVMHVPETGKYYAVQWFSWTQGGQGGGFSYSRKELDLTKLNEGVKFADGTVLKSAEGLGRVKSTAVGDRRIEEAHGYKEVSVTSRVTNNYTGVSARTTTTNYEIFVERTEELDAILQPIWDNGGSEISISFDNVTFQPAWLSSIQAEEYWFYYNNNNSYVPQTQGDNVYIRITSGAEPVVWWDKADLPGGSANFRGAVIDYHAYTGESTIIGSIHIVDDDGEEHISHQEVQSGSSDGENDDLWLVTSEGQIRYRRIDGESKTLKIHWTAKVFYGSELYD